MKRLQRKWLAFGLPEEQEKRYRQRYLRVDVNQAVIGLMILIVPLIAFSYNDYILFGWSPTFYALGALRIVLLAFSIYLIFYLRKMRSYHNYDRLLFIWLLIGIAATMIINLTRSQNFVMHALIDIVLILVFYLVVPGKLLNQIILASLFTIAEGLILIFDKNPALQTMLFTVVFTFILANAAGLVGSWRLQTFRRSEFMAYEREQLSKRKLERMAMTDGLTGIYNSRAFMKIAESELTRFQRYGRMFTFLMMDIDHFKLVNDSYGHLAGDSVLKKLVGAVTSQLRQIDIMGRLGGEEFGIILPETDKIHAQQVAVRIQEIVRKMEVVAEAKEPIKVTISIGLSEALSDDTTPDAFIARADAAMYRAKRNGRDRVEIADTGPVQHH